MDSQPRVRWTFTTSPEQKETCGNTVTVSLHRDVMVVETESLQWIEPYGMMVRMTERREQVIIRRDKERTWVLPKESIPDEALKILHHEFARKYRKGW